MRETCLKALTVVIFIIVGLYVVIYNGNMKYITIPGTSSNYEQNKPESMELDKPIVWSKVNVSKLINLTTHVNISGQEYEALFEKYCMSIEVECLRQERIGKTGEGGWDMCVDSRFVPTPPCLIYSFGINNEWYFDDACDLKFKCVHRAFDPSMKGVNHKRGKNIWFYAEGLASKDFFTNNTMWRLNTLSSLRNIFNETNTVIDYLKIDVEYWEWESLQAAIDQGALKNVKQLGVEFHRDEIMAKTTTMANYKRFFKVLEGLRHEGFYKWTSHSNPQSITAISTYSNVKIMCCYEIIYLNARFL